MWAYFILILCIFLMAIHVVDLLTRVGEAERILYGPTITNSICSQGHGAFLIVETQHASEEMMVVGRAHN